MNLANMICSERFEIGIAGIHRYDQDGLLEEPSPAADISGLNILPGGHSTPPPAKIVRFSDAC